MIKIRKSLIKTLSIFILVLLMVSQTTCAFSFNSDKTYSISKDTRQQDDFFNTVNREWINNAVIDEGQTSNSEFYEVAKTVAYQNLNILLELLRNQNKYPKNSDEKNIINLYYNISNKKERNKQGIEPIKNMLNKIKNAKTLDDITKFGSDNEVIDPLIQLSCDIDHKQSDRYALYISPTSLSLGNSDEYLNPTEDTKRLKKALTNYYTKILMLTGYTKEEAKVKIENRFKFEQMIAPSIKGQIEYSTDNNIANNNYNIYTLDELDKLAPNIKIKQIFKDLEIENAEKIILTEPKWLGKFNEIFINENIELIKDYLEIYNIDVASQFLSNDFIKASNEFDNEYFGTEGAVEGEGEAIAAINNLMPLQFGKLYAERYFSEREKKDVENIAKQVIETYKQRIKNYDWMSDTTKEMAIKKLDKLNVQIGYPSKWLDYSELEIKSYKEGGSLWQNAIDISIFEMKQDLKNINQKVDKSYTSFSPQEVNAFYKPAANTIIVPAAILQGEFYDYDFKQEKKLGAIGTVIGHEISHAFDNTGAKFDSDGNLYNWWTEQDYKKFEEKTQKVRDFYSTIQMESGKYVNGDLTVKENVSDISSMACILDIMSQIKNADYNEFFESYATMYRDINTQNYEDYKLLYDTHSPNKVRVNTVLSQFEKFYEIYNIKEGDKMYIPSEQRLSIW